MQLQRARRKPNITNRIISTSLADIFFAIRGNKTSGTKFINEALSKGASAIISNKKKPSIRVIFHLFLKIEIRMFKIKIYSK